MYNLGYQDQYNSNMNSDIFSIQYPHLYNIYHNNFQYINIFMRVDYLHPEELCVNLFYRKKCNFLCQSNRKLNMFHCKSKVNKQIKAQVFVQQNYFRKCINFRLKLFLYSDHNLSSLLLKVHNNYNSFHGIIGMHIHDY